MIGMRDRETGKIVAKPIWARESNILQYFVRSFTKPTAEVYTDEAPGYRGMPRDHFTVNHSKGEYGLTNGIESFWALLKRAYTGVYHQMSPKHLHRYVTEFQERHNRRPLSTIERMRSIVVDGVGKRLRYVDLIREK